MNSNLIEITYPCMVKNEIQLLDVLGQQPQEPVPIDTRDPEGSLCSLKSSPPGSPISHNDSKACDMEIDDVNKSWDDIDEGVKLILNLIPYCRNCGTRATPQWRSGWWDEMLCRSVKFCNACGIKYSRGEFCEFCGKVYGKQDTLFGWTMCECKRRCHVSCLSKHSKTSTDDERSVSYKCETCILRDCKIKKYR